MRLCHFSFASGCRDVGGLSWERRRRSGARGLRREDSGFTGSLGMTQNSGRTPAGSPCLPADSSRPGRKEVFGRKFCPVCLFEAPATFSPSLCSFCLFRCLFAAFLKVLLSQPFICDAGIAHTHTLSQSPWTSWLSYGTSGSVKSATVSLLLPSSTSLTLSHIILASSFTFVLASLESPPPPTATSPSHNKFSEPRVLQRSAISPQKAHCSSRSLHCALMCVGPHWWISAREGWCVCVCVHVRASERASGGVLESFTGLSWAGD